MEHVYGVENVDVWSHDDFKSPTPGKINIVKCHRPDESLASRGDFILSTHRDQTDIMESMKRRERIMQKTNDQRFRRSGDWRHIGRYRNWGEYWKKQSQYIQDFKLIDDDPEWMVVELCILFGFKDIKHSLVVDMVNNQTKVSQNEYNTRTFIIPNHITKPNK